MDQATYYFYVFLVPLLLLLMGGIFLYKWYFAKKYTRERFAFYGIWSFKLLLIGLAFLFWQRNQFLDLMVGLLGDYGFRLEKYEQVNFLPAAGFVLACASLYFLLIYWLHRNWDGVPSTRQMESLELQRRIGVIEDYLYCWKRRNLEQLEIYKDPAKTKPEVFSPYTPESRPWHERAANLFSLLDQQYHIVLEKDWYGEHHCFIARYGQEGDRIAILCVDQYPTDNQLQHFFTFAQRRSDPFERFIVAIAGQGSAGSGSRGGIEYQLRFESELLDSLISFQHYRDYIFAYFDEHILENSEQLRMADMYVPLGGHTVQIEKGKLNKDRALDSVEAHILDWAKGQRRHATEQVAVLGDYGQGKTVLMHKLVYAMLRQPEEYPRIPILIELRGLSPRNDDELSILSHWAKRYKAKAEALWELHRAGKLLLILDGFDEMDLVGDTEVLFNHFAQLWALARVPQAQIIIAGRPNLFADDEQRRMALGIQEPRTDLPYAQGIYLDKLRDPQIEQVLRQAKAETRQGILSALERAPQSSFAEVITRPSTLFQLSAVWDEELEQRLERLNSALVTGSFITKTYERQQRKGSTVLTAFERSFFMQGIAVGMMLEGGYSNQIKHKDLERLVERLWRQYPPRLSPYGDAMQGGKALGFLPERMKENPHALETILRDVRAGGILVQDLSGRDVFKFAHKSYLEYLVSAFFSAFLLQNEHERMSLMMVNAIAKTLGFSNAKLKSSSDVELFAAELIAGQIELKDATGNPLSVAAAPQKYAQRLYHLLILQSYPLAGRLYPRWKAWLSLHPHLRYFLWMGIGAIGCILAFLLLPKAHPWREVPVIINSVICFAWTGLMLTYRFNKTALDYHPAGYLSKFRLYLLSAELLNCPTKKYPLTSTASFKHEIIHNSCKN
jgi:hypothetical protein